MLKKVLAIVSVIISVIGIIVLWLYLPEEQSAWLKWTVMGLMTTIIMFIVYWWWKQRSISQVKSEEHDLQILLKQDTRVIQQLFQVATKKILGQGHSKLKSLYSLPWYLVIGGENDSKSEILLQNGFEVISTADILFCKADDNYTEIYLNNNKKKVVSKTLKYFEEALQDSNFARVHKSYLVNVNEVVKYVKGKGGSVILSNGKEVMVSPSRKSELLSYFE